MSIHLKRTATILNPDQSRVLLRPFNPGAPERVARIIARIMALPEERVGPLLDEVCADFCQRHQGLDKLFLERFEQLRESLSPDQDLSEKRRLLIGSYFLAEYSLESAALFNPSIVPHPDQTDLPTGALRFILSLRATGEGHISSVTFRTGIVHPGLRIEVLPTTGFLTEPRQIPNPVYEKALFGRKLSELRLTGEFTRRVMHTLGESFTLNELRASLQTEQFRLPDGMTQEDQAASQGMWMLARSNYEVQFQRANRSPNAYFSRQRPPNAMASRTLVSLVSRTTTAPAFTTQPSPPTMAGSWCPSWWRLLISSSFAS